MMSERSEAIAIENEESEFDRNTDYLQQIRQFRKSFQQKGKHSKKLLVLSRIIYGSSQL